MTSDRFHSLTVTLATGWEARYVMPPSRLFGANGIREGADGRIYIAQLSGSRISAMDPDSRVLEHLEVYGGEIIGPDDLVFDGLGNLYITEYTEHRVSERKPNGETRVLQGDIFGSNPITFHDGHLIAGECRSDARIMELDRNGGTPRIILDHIPMTNAFSFGPDGKLYFPVMGANQIWRINLDGSECEVVAGDLGVPDSVKFDRQGRIISTQVGSGQVLRIDPQTGNREVLAEIGPGLDNCTFVGDRLFVSHMTGSIHEILAPGKLRELNSKGLLWPMGVAVGTDGAIYVADGSYAYVGSAEKPLSLVGMLFTPGYPGFHRGVCAVSPDVWAVTTAAGEVKLYTPTLGQNETLCEGYDLLMGIVSSHGGALLFVEGGTGRVLSYANGHVEEVIRGLDQPRGIALDAQGQCYVVESGAGRVLRTVGGRTEVVLDGLQLPEGLTISGDQLFVLDIATRQLLQYSLTAGALGARAEVIASGLPIGAPDGPRKTLGPAGEFSGPMLSFAGLAASPDGTLYLGADGNGSVMAISPQRNSQ